MAQMGISAKQIPTNEGKVKVYPRGGMETSFVETGAGDLVEFLEAMECTVTWSNSDQELPSTAFLLDLVVVSFELTGSCFAPGSGLGYSRALSRQITFRYKRHWGYID
ncbi:hypothetical protein MUK42_35385 [Musa troglodytarum]|uniref:Uncharacterized protein n=1 Tax=Musa troglodytarum TaxID=320322 RepID=A0A9E7G7Q8_9LILI|nr:hypothetical protein MUK42_35385 [Musa troglodytarum]